MPYTAEDGIERLRVLLGTDHHYSQVLAGFEAIDRGRRNLRAAGTSVTERRAAAEDIWRGNTLLLEHEQRAVVQPHFDRLSRTFASLASLGSPASFDVRPVRCELGYFTSFYGYSFTGGVPHVIRGRAWPLITRFDDRWRWLTTRVIPRFRRLDADTALATACLRRIVEDTSSQANHPCTEPTFLPGPARGIGSRRSSDGWALRPNPARLAG